MSDKNPAVGQRHYAIPNDSGYCMQRLDTGQTCDLYEGNEIHDMEKSSPSVVTWHRTRWWRLVKKGKLMAESSSEREIRGFAERDGGQVQQLWEATQSEWRDA